MLKIKHKLQISSIHGIGLFTLEKINKGDIIAELNKFDIEVLINSVDEKDKPFFEHYFAVQGEFYQTYFDDMRFMNTSKTHNCVDLPNGQCVAIRDIEINEELTCDYSLICDLYNKM